MCNDIFDTLFLVEDIDIKEGACKKNQVKMDKFSEM